jgi:intracellular sulfur oxidation DsrE/DsrF family protein
MDSTHRRGFLGRLAGAAAALGLPLAPMSAAARQAGPDDWIGQVKGQNRCFFDFPRHMNAFGLVHVFNYLNTYKEAYKAGPGQAAAVGTFYGIGPGASLAMAFDDATWAKYKLGEYHGLKDAAGQFYTRNPFHRPTKADAHLLAQWIQAPSTPPALAELMPACGIESLQKMGTTFLLCNNALGAWTFELEARGKGTAAELQKELPTHLLPGVIPVPAMVIAIDKAQKAGIAYNRQ